MPQPRLLLIDDEPALAEFLANAARETGFETVITSEDSDFRDRFRQQRPDMVALDLGMPGMDGVELLRFLAEEDYRAPRRAARALRHVAPARRCLSTLCGGDDRGMRPARAAVHLDSGGGC